MRVCEEPERRSERGSGIGTRSEEGGDDHQKGRCRGGGLEKWEGRKRGKVQWIVLSLWCRRAFPPLEKPPVFLELIFSCFSVHPARLPFPPSPRFCALLTFYQSPCFTALSFYLSASHPVSIRLSMASALCYSPPIVFNLCSPRMHLFKSCFTKTVLKQIENVKMMKVFTRCEGGGGEKSKLT